ncbi:MAG: heme ABC transporter ATP-binding protein [Bacteroidota bacterium]
MIVVKNLAVNKGGQSIVRGINLQVRPGRISVLLGKNGAGKSTVLEALTGKNTFSEGNITWDNYPLTKLTNQTLAQRRAVLSQSVTVPFAITVQQLVEMGTYVATEALPNQKIASLVEEALTTVGLSTFGTRNFQTLSGGEQKRALLAKCLVQLNCCHWADVNKYLFLDEPTAGLDMEQQFHLLALLKRLVRRRQIGVLAVVHDVNLAAQLADELILLKAGQIATTGSPGEVLTPELLQEVFSVTARVHPHPVLDCPYVTLLPHQPTAHSASFSNSTY